MSEISSHNLSAAEQRRLADLDRRHVWHPFTQHSLWNQTDPLIIVGGEAEYVIDADGRRYIDGHSSMWCNLHGHRRPEIDAAIRAQLDKVAHTTQLGLASPPAIELAKRLVDIAPAGLNKVFYSDDGSTSVEVACKLAYGYWHHRSEPRRDRFIALRNAYHGDTIGAVSVGGIDLFHHAYAPLLFETEFAPSPYCYRCDLNDREACPLGGRPTAALGGRASCPPCSSEHIPHPLRSARDGAPIPPRVLSKPDAHLSGEARRAKSEVRASSEPTATTNIPCLAQLGELLRQHAGRIAAVIVEPLIQAAAGMITAPPGYLACVRELCDECGTLLIADEVATGFGRTGRMFACEHEAVAPDLLCLSKGLTSGYLPLAATLATDDIYEAFLGSIDSGRTFYHGHTFTGNPLGCAAALASLDIFERDRVLESLPPKIALLAAHLERLRDNPHVGDVRQCGLMAGIELVRDKATREAYAYGQQIGAQVCAHARQYGVILRPLADTIVVMPPLCITLENLEHLLRTAERCINEVVPRLAILPTSTVDNTNDGLE